ncbi:MAG: cell division protein ZipA [Pseudomonadales bacterium]|nr:cell division protein ZipA [Pseudomonadales bacterium]
MEIGLREILILVGVVVIGVILLDGLRRMRQSRKSALGMSIDVGGSASDFDFSGELPKGGARVAAGYEEQEDRLEPSFVNDPVDYEDPLFATPKITTFDEVETSYSDYKAAKANEKRTAEQADNSTNGSATPTPVSNDGAVKGEQEEMFSGTTAEKRQTDQNRYKPETKTNESGVSAEGLEPALTPKTAVQDVVIIYLIAEKDSVIKGRQLLQQLLNLGLRYGEMNIFHRHEKANSEGCLMFSVANIEEPGTFDIDNMSDFTTPGVCLFLSLPGPERAMYAFDMLVDTARKVSNALNCEMLDEKREVMTQETIENYRVRVSEFESSSRVI